MLVVRTVLATLAALLLVSPSAGAATEAVIHFEVTGPGTIRFEVLGGVTRGGQPIGATCGGVTGSALPQANLRNPTGVVQRLCTATFTVDGCASGVTACDLVMKVDGRRPNTPQVTNAEATAKPAHWIELGWAPSELPLAPGQAVTGCAPGESTDCTFKLGRCEASGCTYLPEVALRFGIKDQRPATAVFRCRDAGGAHDPSTTCGPPPTLNTDPAGRVLFHARSNEFVAAEYATLECSLDGADWKPCPAAGPLAPGTFAYPSVSDGPHEIAVRAIDPSQNLQTETPATVAFTQRYPPDTRITGGPTEGQAITERRPRFTFAADRLATFECEFDGKAVPCKDGSWTPQANLAHGEHAFSVRGTRSTPEGAVVEPEPAVRRFSVDLVRPEAAITGGPEDELVTTSSTAVFTFEGDADISYFCQLDGAEPQPCDGGRVEYRSLPAGRHTFTLTAFDSAGNGLEAPLVRRWTVITDADSDRHYAPDSDCDDGNPSVWLGAPEVPGNGIDENCDGTDPPNLDVDGDGFLAAPQGRDCDDRNPDRRPGAPEIAGNGIDEDCDKVDPPDLDKDRDGVLAPPVGGDCDDEDPAIRPGVRDVPENGIDENCNELDARLRPIGLRFGALWQPFDRYTAVVAFDALDVPAGTVIRFKCRGGCRKAAGRIVVRRKRAKIALRSFIGRRMAPGAVLEVRAARPGRLTEVHRWRFRAGRPPTRQDRCVRRGKVGRC